VQELSNRTVVEDGKINLRKAPVISIIDDDASVREATKELLRSLGYLAATFSSAEEFLRSDRLHDTSCLISDIKMPGMSGIELQGRLLADGHRLPIIFVTAFPEERLRKRALAAGALCFLSKPFPEERLIGYLREALEADGRTGSDDRSSD
jgi:FixJ family two-component response regulator